MAQKKLPRELDLSQQINDLDISAMPDDISSLAPDSTTNAGNQLYKSHAHMPTSTASRLSRPSFMNFGQSGKKSPLGRAAINRMTQNLVSTQKNYMARRSTIIEPQKMPIAPREMWKPLDDEESDDSEKKRVARRKRFRTIVKEEKDMEVFETEDVDSDEETDSENGDADESMMDVTREERRKEKAAAKQAPPQEEQQAKPDYGHLVKGVDILDDEISTMEAFKIFRELEEKETAPSFKPPEVGSGARTDLDGRFNTEIPSLKIDRLTRELEELQQELIDLEKEEIPTRMADQAQSAKQSLQTIDELRSFMHNVVSSTGFQDMEKNTTIDMQEILQKAYSKQAGTAQANGAKSNNSQDLKKAIQELLSNNVAKMNPELIKGAQVNNEIELFMNVDQSPNEVQKFKEDLLVEQHKRFLIMQKELDECEKISGAWDPINKFNNLYETLDAVQDEIDEFNATNEDSKMAPTPTNQDRMNVPQTPGGTRNKANIANKAKQFDQELRTLQQKFTTMEDVTYDQQKVKLVFDMTERALEQRGHFEIILERLNVLEKMNKESPALEAKFQAIVKRTANEIPQALLAEQADSHAARQEIIAAAAELDKLV